jgi:hypothetical protein
MSTPSLYKKILQVMKDVQYLQKDDKVSTGGTNSYKAISEEKVTETVRASLINNGLVILPIEQEHKRDDTLLRTEKTFNGVPEIKETVSRLSTVNTKYKIVDVDTGEFEILASSGTGVDTQDKGVGKAMTYSYKYMLLRTFAIPTGEDPDKISSDTISDEQSGSKPIKQGNQSGTKPQGNTGQNKPSDGPSDKEFGQMVDNMAQKTCTDPTCKTPKTVLKPEVIKFSVSKFGKVLCRYCQEKHKSA